jgi:hypothetical protein
MKNFAYSHFAGTLTEICQPTVKAVVTFPAAEFTFVVQPRWVAYWTHTDLASFLERKFARQDCLLSYHHSILMTFSMLFFLNRKRSVTRVKLVVGDVSVDVS